MLTSFIKRAVQLFPLHYLRNRGYIYTHVHSLPSHTQGLYFCFSFPSHQKSESFCSSRVCGSCCSQLGRERENWGKKKKEDGETQRTKALQAEGAAAPGLRKNSQLLQSAVGFCFHGCELGHPLFIQYSNTACSISERTPFQGVCHSNEAMLHKTQLKLKGRIRAKRYRIKT